MKKKRSPCCNAKIDYIGGGYNAFGEACNVETCCKECGQILTVNGFEEEVRNPKTGELLKEEAKVQELLNDRGDDSGKYEQEEGN